METFEYDGDTYNIPAAWQNIDNQEEWFYLIEKAKDSMMKNADKYPPMDDEDGDQIEPEVVVLMQEYGIESYRQWDKFSTAYSIERWNTDGEDDGSFLIRTSSIARDRMSKELVSSAQGEGGLLSPFEGISLQQWAGVNAGIIGAKGTPEELKASIGCDAAKWDLVNAEWNARMAKDTTFAIATAYGNAFTASSTGAYAGGAQHAANVGTAGDLSDEPISFEKWVEIGVAQQAASANGSDVQEALAKFDVNIMDWSNMSMFWSKKLMQESTKYARLYDEYTEKYQAQYGLANVDSEDDELSL